MYWHEKEEPFSVLSNLYIIDLPKIGLIHRWNILTNYQCVFVFYIFLPHWRHAASWKFALNKDMGIVSNLCSIMFYCSFDFSCSYPHKMANILRMSFSMLVFQSNCCSDNGLGPAQIAKFLWPTWGPPGSWRPQMGPMLASWTLISG